MFNPVTISIGRLVQAVAGLRGGGTALPGLVVEKLNPHFAAEILGTLPLGVVLVSGTNGKTTTVKAVTELLSAAGLKVFTNNTGSNFMRGVISSLLRKVQLNGRLDADIAVLELDEAHAVNFVAEIKPRYSLLLNVMRDQLDRFGEIDYTAELLSAVARNTTDIVVLNHDDSRLAAIPERENLEAQVRWFGLAPQLLSEFPEDDALYNEELQNGNEVSAAMSDLSPENDDSDSGAVSVAAHSAASGQADSEDNRHSAASTLLVDYQNEFAYIEVDGIRYKTQLALKGTYNALNATAALALVHAVLPKTPVEQLVESLAQIRSAFGRGESVEVDGQPVELILVKNPGGFRLALKSFDPAACATMIAVNDDYGDGRDISWFYDVSFASLRQKGVSMVGGARAYDMALRLKYDEVPIEQVQTDLSKALDAFIAQTPDTPKRIYCSYTMMMALRRLLAGKTQMERVQ